MCRICVDTTVNECGSSFEIKLLIPTPPAGIVKNKLTVCCDNGDTMIGIQEAAGWNLRYRN